MALDVELYRRTVYAPAGPKSARLRRISVIDIAPEGATQTIVMIHGYGGRALQWLYQLQAFGSSTRVVAPDLRGHGGSDDPDELPVSMDALVDELELVLDALGVPGPVALLAHSFGGAIAVDFALRHPEQVSQLVLIGMPSHFIVRPGVRQLMNLPRGLFPVIRDTFRIPLYAKSLKTMRRMYDKAMSRWDGTRQLERVSVPTLVVMGERDTVFVRDTYEEVARCIPGAKSVVIPVSAHLVQLERPDAVNRAIRRFIDPQPSGAFGALAAPSRPLAGGRTPTSRLAAMPWLQYYDTDVPHDLPLPAALPHDLVVNAANDHPDRPAVVYFGQKIGYRELDHLTNRFAAALRKLGVQKGDRVAIVLPNVPQWLVGFYGTLKAGAVAALASPLSSEAEIAAHLKDSGACTLLTLTSYADMARRVCAGTDVRQVIFTDVREYLPLLERVALASRIEAMVRHPVVSGEHPAPGDLPAPLAGGAGDQGDKALPYKRYALQQLLRSQPARPLDPGVAPDDLAVLLYTSGTVERPKGVMLTHRNLMVNVAQVRHWLPEARRGREVVLCALSLAHSYGLTSALDLCMALTGTLVLLPTTRIQQVVEAIKGHHPTIFPAVPAMYRAIANYPKIRSYGVSSIRFCISGSAPLPVEVQEAFEKLTRGRLVEGYGLTEASPATHSNPLQGERRVGSIGVPLPGTQARIADPASGATLPPGEVGELLIRGPQVMRGYWNRPEQTAETLRDGWLHTGDLATMDEDGFFAVVDREPDVILAGPYNVYPREVEEVLYEHPKVLEVAVVGAPDPTDNGGPGGGRLVKAVVVLRRGERATADELLALARERLEAYKVPSIVEFRDELPKNFVGKVLRRLLVES